MTPIETIHSPLVSGDNPVARAKAKQSAKPSATEARWTARRSLEADVAERFTADVANHQMTILHNDGLYRHVRFAQPEHSWNAWFDLITWPGNLAIKGDMGTYVFARIQDMFEFFRHNGNTHRINAMYWAEKLPDCGKSVKKYSEDTLRACLEPYLTEYEQDYPERLAEYEDSKTKYDALSYVEQRRLQYRDLAPVEPETIAEIRKVVQDADDTGQLDYEDGARDLLGELEKRGVVSDTWEWDLSDWDSHYLWCCHAIVWGIAQYDAQASRPVETVASL